MSISKNCMVVNVCIGVWTGYRLDRNASRQVTEAANAQSDAARVSKSLISKEALDPIIASAAMIRKHVYTSTLPWKDNGDRLLPRAMYQTFIQEHEIKVAQFNAYVETFLESAYPVARAQAEFRLGTLFNDADYPTAEALKSKFYVHLDIDPVTESGDFRVEMDQAQLDAIRDSIDRATSDRISRAVVDVWARLSDTLSHFAEKMSTDSIFRDATVNNLHEIVKILPQLNILGDPNLDKVRRDIETSLLTYSARDLRKDPETKKTAADEAQRIMSDMRGFMSAFGGN